MRIKFKLSSAVVLVLAIVLTAQPLVVATTLVTVTGTIGFTDPESGAVRTVSQVPVQFSSGTTSANQTTYTNASGQYSVTLPAGPNYTMSVEWMPALTDPLPSFVSVTLQQLAFSENANLNVTLPAAFKVSATIKDQAGNPLPGATISWGVGSTYGGPYPLVSGYSGTYTPAAINFGSARGYNAVRFPADAQGVATMWSFNFQNPMTGYQQYVSPDGYTLNSTFVFTPTSNIALNLSLNIPTTVTVAGTFSYTDADGSAVAIANAPVSFSSGTLGISKNLRTTSSGGFSVSLPSSTDYTATMEPVFLEPGYQAGTPLPAAVWLQLRDLNFSVSRELNVKLPQATAIRVAVKNQNNEPLAGARVQLQTGSFYGSNSLASISGYSLPVTQLLNFASSFDDKPRVVQSDVNGIATLHVFNFQNTMRGDVRYQNDGGAWLAGSFSFNPSQSQSASATITVPASVAVAGRLAFTRADGSLSPLASKTFTLSSATGGSKSVVTDADGNYATTVGAASDYSLQLAWLPGTTDPLPGNVSLTLQNLDLSVSRTLNMTFPRAKQTRVRLIDAQGNPLSGAYVTYGVGSSFGSSTRPTFGAFGESSTVLMSFGGGQGGYVKRYPVDANGYATIWSYGFPNPISAMATFQVPGGFTAQREFSFIPDSTTEATVEFDNILVAQSLGYNPGGLSMFTPVGTSIEGFTITPSRANDIPDGAFDLTGVLAYEVRGLTLGQTVAVQFNLPEGIPPTDVFKIINDELVDISSLATISGRTVTLILKDGGAGDDDGTVNGVIRDPVMFINKASLAQTSSGSSGSVSTTSGVGVNNVAPTGAVVPGAVGAQSGQLSASGVQAGSATATVQPKATPAATGQQRTPVPGVVSGSSRVDSLNVVRTGSSVKVDVALGKAAASKLATISVKRPGSKSFAVLNRVKLNFAGRATLSWKLLAGTVVRVSLAGRTVAVETIN